jgi:hypothetical protein
VVIGTYQIKLVPNALLGRVGSASGLIAWGVIPLGSLLAGLVLQRYGAAVAAVALAIGMILTAVAATVAPSVRRTVSVAPATPSP